MAYKCDAEYDPTSEVSIAYNDPDLSIDWERQGISPYNLSKKDQDAMTMQQFLDKQV